MADSKVTPFKVQVSDELLKDLRERLDRTRFPGDVTDSGWEYGTNLAYLKDLVEYWRMRYDWRVHEAEINRFAQYRAEIYGLGIHFIHEPGRGPNPKPLLSRTDGQDRFTNSCASSRCSPTLPRMAATRASRSR